MRLKASTDYGVRTVLYLASKNDTCSSKDIAEDMEIPRDYLIQLAQLLRNAGIIEARPGKHGGYRLAKEPAEISAFEIINALEKKDKKSLSKQDGVSQGIKSAHGLIEEKMTLCLNDINVEMLLDHARQHEGKVVQFSGC